jgi:hypothetical protein
MEIEKAISKMDNLLYAIPEPERQKYVDDWDSVIMFMRKQDEKKCKHSGKVHKLTRRNRVLKRALELACKTIHLDIVDFTLRQKHDDNYNYADYCLEKARIEIQQAESEVQE